MLLRALCGLSINQFPVLAFNIFSSLGLNKHIGVAIAEGKRTKGYGVEGEKTYSENNSLRDPNSHEVDFSEFTNEDGHLKGGIDVEMTGPQETAEEKVRGQGRMLPEKRKTAKWF